jgi:hypothetical protein
MLLPPLTLLLLRALLVIPVLLSLLPVPLLLSTLWRFNALAIVLVLLDLTTLGIIPVLLLRALRLCGMLLVSTGPFLLLMILLLRLVLLRALLLVLLLCALILGLISMLVLQLIPRCSDCVNHRRKKHQACNPNLLHPRYLFLRSAHGRSSSKRL